MKDYAFIVRVSVVTLATVIIVMVLALLYGLYDVRVDNKTIFGIIGPAFQTVIGCFVGFLGGLVRGREEK